MYQRRRFGKMQAWVEVEGRLATEGEVMFSQCIDNRCTLCKNRGEI